MAARNLSLADCLHHSLQYTITVDNKIRGNGFLVVHIEVCRVKARFMMNRFYNVFDSAAEFFENKDGSLWNDLVIFQNDTA